MRGVCIVLRRSGLDFPNRTWSDQPRIEYVQNNMCASRRRVSCHWVPDDELHEGEWMRTHGYRNVHGGDKD